MSAAQPHRHILPYSIVSERPTNMSLRSCRPILSRARPAKDFSSSPTMNENDAGANAPDNLDAVFEAKHALRSKVRTALKNMDPAARAREDAIIQSMVVEAPWFKMCRSLCAYITCASLREVDTSRIVREALSGSREEGNGHGRKKLYVPRVEDRNSNMRMLKISGVDDLVVNSMNILEPALVDSENNPREDVMEASDPVDVIILPGLAFDRSGRRLGRSGGYYDKFLKKYNSLVKEQMWVKKPCLVGLSYSVQLMEEGAIPITPNDVPVDALVTPDGFFRTSPYASEKH